MREILGVPIVVFLGHSMVLNDAPKLVFLGHSMVQILFHIRHTGQLGTCGANRDRVPEPIGIQMKSFFQLGVPGDGQDKKLMME